MTQDDCKYAKKLIEEFESSDVDQLREELREIVESHRGKHERIANFYKNCGLSRQIVGATIGRKNYPISFEHYVRIKSVGIYTDPEKSSGVWIERFMLPSSHNDSCTRYQCSICNSFSSKDSPFCPECGTKMLGRVATSLS